MTPKNQILGAGMTFRLPPGTRGAALLAFALLVLAPLPAARAGEAEEASSRASFGPVEITGPGLEISKEGSEYVVTASDVVVRWEGATLRAGRAVAWVEGADEEARDDDAKEAPRLPGGSPKAPKALDLAGEIGVTLYAEGDVRLSWGEDRVRCERFLYDFRARKGLVIDARADLHGAFGKTPVPEGSRLVARAESIRLAFEEDGSGVVRLDGASVTDCGFYTPHYDFRASEVRIDVGPGEDPEVWAAFSHLTVNAFGVPVFYWPWLMWNARWRPMIRFRPGRTASLGAFLKAGVGMEVKAPRPGPGKGEKRLGTFWLLGDWYEKRGGGVGAEGRWGWPWTAPFRGNALLAYLHDRGDHREAARQLGFYPLETEDRWRAWAHHRQRIPPFGTQADLEINAYGDRNFLLEFYEEEWKTEKPPESYIQILQRWENHGAVLLARPRINDFLTRVEYLPRFRYRGVSQALPGCDAVVTPFLEASHVRTRPDDADPTLHSDRFFRFDAGAEAAWPFRILLAEVEPFVRARYSVFGASVPVEGTVDRAAVEAGVRTTIRAWRDFRLPSDLLGFSTLRHVATLQADYLNRFLVTRPSTDLIPVDEMERVDEIQRVDLRLTNRLERWRGTETPVRGRDLLHLDVELAIYPDPARDNAGDRFGPALFDLRLAPFPWLRFESVSAIDVDAWAFDRWDAGITALPLEGIEIAVTSSNVPGRLHSVTTRAIVRFNEKWSVRFEEMYDFERGREAYLELKVRRVLHRWVLEIGIHVDRSREDVGFSVSFLPLL